MLKLVLHLSVGRAGANDVEFYILENETLWEIYNGKAVGEDILGTFAWERACQYAEMYGIYPSDGEDGYEYCRDIEGYFEIFNPEKHDALSLLAAVQRGQVL